ncbi:extracellular serine/threonine protein kinase four-jointed [Chironomus tepperi]|uniref:extracellular serine/threonine protein kinase four-jointed n=1 Tax=Chironomus tepperi TaxID=113505 RepID=UPI00391F569F
MIANEKCQKSSDVVENCKVDKSVAIDDKMLLILRKKRRAFYQHTCLLSVMAAFTIGLAIGIFFLPLIGLTSASTKSTDVITSAQHNSIKHAKLHKYDFNKLQNRNQIDNNNNNNNKNPTIYSSVSFISDDTVDINGVDDDKYSGGLETATNEFILNNNGKVNNNNDYAIAGVTVNVDDEISHAVIDENSYNNNMNMNIEIQSHEQQENSYEKENNETLRRIIDDDIYWGQMIENRIPNGFAKRDTEDWQNYLHNNVTEIIKIEQGCGRMQNRLVTFSDGVKACVRYRQNTDQIQGELFSFFLGRLLNITNLVPSAAAVIDWESRLWTQVKQHITESQWKTSRPVVFTKWIPDLEPSGIPEQFRPLERHMNKNDIWNVTLSDGGKPSQILIERLKSKYNVNNDDGSDYRKKLLRKKKITLNDKIYDKLIELAQWSDLIIFDYLIANLDRVVNNLYNYQWNADIMAAPAHNLAKQINSQLLVFLDNESGLLHGYRLLKKYEAYHSLLLDDLCIFRKSTIDALKYIRDNNAGELLNELFEQTTTNEVRDVLPPLPEKSIKILTDRIDHVLQQVQKCQDMYSNR